MAGARSCPTLYRVLGRKDETGTDEAEVAKAAQEAREPEDTLDTTDEADAEAAMPPSLGIAPEWLQLVLDGMNRAVNHIRGTAYGSAIKIDGRRMAGKTGTAQVRASPAANANPVGTRQKTCRGWSVTTPCSWAMRRSASRVLPSRW